MTSPTALSRFIFLLFSSVLFTVLFLGFSLCTAPESAARVVFKNEFVSDQVDNTLVIDVFDDVDPASNISLQFGNALGKTLDFDVTNDWFSFSDEVNFNQNQLYGVVFENQPNASIPASPVAGQIYHNTDDGNTYVYNGSGWEDITAVSSTATKVVTVGTGLDWTTPLLMPQPPTSTASQVELSSSLQRYTQ